MVFPWYVLLYNHPEKIKITDSFYFVSIQSRLECYMTNVHITEDWSQSNCDYIATNYQ